MQYPVAVWNTNGVYSASIPDLPGVITEADSEADLACSLKEASQGWIEAELDLGRAIPEPRPVAAHESDPTFEGCCWTMFDINLDKIKADRKTS